MIGKIKEKKTIIVPIIAISLSHEFIKNNMDTMGAKKQAAICDFNIFLLRLYSSLESSICFLFAMANQLVICLYHLPHPLRAGLRVISYGSSALHSQRAADEDCR